MHLSALLFLRVSEWKSYDYAPTSCRPICLFRARPRRKQSIPVRIRSAY